MNAGRCAWLLFVLAGFSPGLQADVDVSEYQVSGAVRSEREKARLEEEFARQRVEEEARLRKAEEEIRRLRAEEEARRAARPWPVRLTEARCTLCHAAANYEGAAHALPGWIAVILRMRYFNLAPLDWEDTWVIGRHLSETRPADGLTALLEWSAAAALVAGVVFLLYWNIRRRRRHGKKEG